MHTHTHKKTYTPCILLYMNICAKYVYVHINIKVATHAYAHIYALHTKYYFVFFLL